MTHDLMRLAAVVDDVNLPKPAATGEALVDLLNIFLGIVGAVAVLVTVLAGIQLMLSEGNSEKVAKARRSILYAVIGLAVTLFASVIVNFVVVQMVKP